MSYLSWPLHSRSFKSEVTVGQMYIQWILEAECYGALLSYAWLTPHLSITMQIRLKFKKKNLSYKYISSSITTCTCILGLCSGKSSSSDQA